MKPHFMVILFAAGMAAMLTLVNPLFAEDVWNNETIETANVVGGNSSFHNGYNGGTGTVQTADVSDGKFHNGEGSGSTGRVETANVRSGWFGNGSSGGTGTVETANVSGGVWGNNHGSTVTTANISGSTQFYNGDGSAGRVETANVNGGQFFNSIGGGGAGTVGTVNLRGGDFYNAGFYGSTGTVETVHMYGGKFYNSGRTSNTGSGFVENLIFDGGEYLYSNGSGSTITNLTLNKAVETAQGAAFSASSVQKLSFGQAYGPLTITALNDGSYTNAINVSAAAIDVTGIDIMLNVSSIFNSLNDVTLGTQFSLQEMFAGNYASVSNGEKIDSFSLLFGNGEQFDVFSPVSDLAAGWYYDSGVVAYSGAGDSSSVPEPATFALVGLGFAGLAAVRRRRK